MLQGASGTDPLESHSSFPVPATVSPLRLWADFATSLLADSHSLLGASLGCALQGDRSLAEDRILVEDSSTLSGEENHNNGLC